jgi:hypothetical protein
VTGLAFDVLDVEAERWSLAPALHVRLRICETSGDRVHALALRTQVRVEPRRRAYSDTERQALLGLFGDARQWGEGLHPFLWTDCGTVVPGFTGETVATVTLPCTYDTETTAAGYLHALDDGAEVPLLLLFSGTVFTRGDSGFAVQPVPWDREARYRMPVAVWREAMDAHFAGQGWLRLQTATLTRLQRFRAERALTTWDDTLLALLEEAGEVPS